MSTVSTVLSESPTVREVIKALLEFDLDAKFKVIDKSELAMSDVCEPCGIYAAQDGDVVME